MPATLLVFLFAYLNLNRWHVRYMHITLGWLAGLAALVAVALFDPAIASGIARLSLVVRRVPRLRRWSSISRPTASTARCC